MIALLGFAVFVLACVSRGFRWWVYDWTRAIAGWIMRVVIRVSVIGLVLVTVIAVVAARYG